MTEVYIYKTIILCYITLVTWHNHLWEKFILSALWPPLYQTSYFTNISSSSIWNNNAWTILQKLSSRLTKYPTGNCLSRQAHIVFDNVIKAFSRRPQNFMTYKYINSIHNNEIPFQAKIFVQTTSTCDKTIFSCYFFVIKKNQEYCLLKHKVAPDRCQSKFL